MDFSKIFIKNASPTKMGGQAVIKGIMMKGGNRTAVVLRKKDGGLHMRTKLLKKHGKLFELPFIRGVFVFVDALLTGTSTLMYSADFLEQEEEETTDKENWISRKFGEKALWNIMLYSSVLISLVFTIGIFIILPTAAVSIGRNFTDSSIALNIIEGILRLLMFVGYIALISLMKDIKEVFQYHGAEHQCIHAFENGLELTVENCRKFETLHPRCGTSFLMFVMIISLVLFSLLGWPNLLWRVLSRLLLVPVIAGISFELLRFAGKSDNLAVKILSIPGLLLQKITTRVPDDSQLEVAIAAIRAVDVPKDTPEYEGTIGQDGRPVEPDGKPDKESVEKSDIEPDEIADEKSEGKWDLD